MPDAKPADAPPQGAGGGAQPGQLPEIHRGYNFKVLVDNVGEGVFTYMSGLGGRVTPIKYRAGGDLQIVHQLVGPVEYGEVSLRYGLTDSMDLFNWFMSAVQGTPQRKNVSIVMLGPGGTGDRVRWNLLEAWPVEWRGAVLDALGREVAIETLTLVYESITRT